MRCNTAKPAISPLAMGGLFSLKEREETLRYPMNLVMMTSQALKRPGAMLKRGTFVFRLKRDLSSHWISSAQRGIIRDSERKGNARHTTTAPLAMHAARLRRSASCVTPRAGMPRNTSKKNWEVIMRLNSRVTTALLVLQCRCSSCQSKNRML